jgi:hypothetical protein
VAAYGGSRSLSSEPTFFAAGRLAALLALSAAPLLVGCAAGGTEDLGGPEDGAGEAADLAAWKVEVQPARTLDKCVYPTENIGVTVGKTVRDQLVWQGYINGENEPTEVAMSEYLDCSGVKSVNALLVVQSATWCGNCESEAQDIHQHMADAEDWPAKGIVPITLMIEDLDQSPARESTALNWRNKFRLNNSVVAADPNISFMDPSASSLGLPLVIIIDPRTMEVVHTQEGYSGDHSLLESLAAKNAK